MLELAVVVAPDRLGDALQVAIAVGQVVDQQPTAGRDHAMELPQRAPRVGDVLEHAARQDEPELRVVVGQLDRLGAVADLDLQAPAAIDPAGAPSR